MSIRILACHILFLWKIHHICQFLKGFTGPTSCEQGCGLCITIGSLCYSDGERIFKYPSCISNGLSTTLEKRKRCKNRISVSLCQMCLSISLVKQQYSI